MQLGARAFINKPCDPKALAEVLKTIEAERGDA
jgi:YesN/AraC family two-component response regulator